MEELTSIELALKAREKGFNTPTVYGSYKDSEGNWSPNIVFDPHGKNWNDKEEELSRPYAAQVFKWLRDVFKIEAEIRKAGSGNYKAIFSDSLRGTLVYSNLCWANEFSIYEDCEDFALDIAFEVLDMQNLNKDLT